MSDERGVTVRMFGLLRAYRQERGLPIEAFRTVPADGIPAEGLAVDLGLPLELIEAVFCNRKVYPLDHVIMPGDRVAFVPYGTPGPHRFYLGIYDAGKASGSAPVQG
ncbi:MAG: MoaD/ThiS family protein [Coriobacteriia bacterium]|nr:MoaD/ThiS family protein [Coriobacteriia bacterium]